MKTISILLLFAIVATTLERITAGYLLVEIDDEEGKETNPTKEPEIGRQCSGTESECPFDTCNGSGCKKGCATGGCTYVGCNDTTKGENQLCVVKSDNCDKGLKCMKQDDGCDNGYGRCVKSESKNRTCGFEGGDCCRNKLPPEERLSTKLKIDCDPGLMCQLNWPSPTANGTCFPERSYVPKLRKEGEPCGGCFGAWCPDSCKDEQCGECEKGLECKRVSLLREPPKRCKKREGPTTAEPKVEAKSVAPVKPVRHTIPLFRPTQKPGKVDLIKDINQRPDFPLNFKTTDPIEILPDIVTRIIIPDELNSTLNSSSNLLKEKKLVELAKRGVCDESCCCDDCFPCAEERIAKIIEGLGKIVMPANLNANDSAIDGSTMTTEYPTTTDYPTTTHSTMITHDYFGTTDYDYPDTTEWSNTEDVENGTSVKIASKVPTPRECCENANVPEFCLGLCTLADAMARQGKRITACSKYDTIIEGCFQAAEPRIQEPETEEQLLSRSGAAVRW